MNEDHKGVVTYRVTLPQGIRLGGSREFLAYETRMIAKEVDALWVINHARAIAGHPPIARLPDGTVFTEAKEWRG